MHPNELQQKPEYVILKSHEENGIIIVDEFTFTGIGIVKEEIPNEYKTL